MQARPVIVTPNQGRDSNLDGRSRISSSHIPVTDEMFVAGVHKNILACQSYPVFDCAYDWCDSR